MFSFSSKFWDRDWKIILLEFLRRQVCWNLPNPLHAGMDDEQAPWAVYTDGSLLKDGMTIYMGAGAVAHFPDTDDYLTFCTPIDPVDLGVVGQIPGTTKPETVALALGLYASYLHQRKCVIITDNLIVASTVRDHSKWYKLKEFDAKSGTLAITLLERGILVGIRWIKSHQTATGHSSDEATWNDLADSLAEASRYRSTISGEFITLPCLAWERYTLIPNDVDSRIVIPKDRNQRLTWEALPFPDQAAAREPMLSYQWMANLQRILYPSKRSTTTSKLAEDTTTNWSLCLTDIRVRNRNAPTAMEKMNARPDIYGPNLWCLACNQQIGYHYSYQHLFFKCPNDKIRRVFRKLLRNNCSGTLLEHLQIIAWQKENPRTQLTGRLQAKDTIERIALCKYCHEYRTVLDVDFSNDLERIPISELRRLWFWLMISSERMNLSTEVDLKGDQTGLWVRNVWLGQSQTTLHRPG